MRVCTLAIKATEVVGRSRIFSLLVVAALISAGCSSGRRSGIAPDLTGKATPRGGAATLPTPTLAPAGVVAPPTGPGGAGLSPLRVAGNRIVDASGRAVSLYGFDDSAASTCIEPNGTVFVNRATVDQQTDYVAAWHGNAVRISLNEDCWLGINGVPKAFDARTYQAGIKAAASNLHGAGYYTILDLHWNAPSSKLAKGQELMADADHSPTFWQSVATAFKGDGDTLFELYNEPHNIDWPCWDNGCTVAAGWDTAGMQSLVDAVRSTGASQILLLGGLGHANDMSGWKQYQPRDQLGQLAAAFHMHNVDKCVDPACWDQSVAPLASTVSVVATEIGERDNGAALVLQFASWADRHAIGYLGWLATRPYAKALESLYRQHLGAKGP